MSDEKPMGQVIQIDEARIRDHLGEMVRGTVEETLNAMLDAEGRFTISCPATSGSSEAVGEGRAAKGTYCSAPAATMTNFFVPRRLATGPSSA